jgi:cell division protease FtsH
LPETSVRKITIIPRLNAGGYTWIVLRNESDDAQLVNKSQILALITGFLAGRISEELIFGSEYITTGASEDFKKSSELVQNLIIHYGMTGLRIVPPFTYEKLWTNHEIFVDLPEKAKEDIANERKKILDMCWEKAQLIIKKKKKILNLLAEILQKKNCLNQLEINYIFINQISPFVTFLN